MVIISLRKGKVEQESKIRCGHVLKYSLECV